MAEAPRSPGLTLAVLFEKYLEWCQKHRAARTYAGYAWHLQAFCDHLKTARTLPALDLKPYHNADGLAWATSAVNCRFCRLKGKLGTKYALYSIRHGFATRKLEAGLDSITVAALMGHSDSAMLNRMYSHVSDHHGYLRDQLNKAE